jgi:hypothetical protein
VPLLEDRAVPLDELLLDPNNYRFQSREDFVTAAQTRYPGATVQQRAYRLLRDEGLEELKRSILTNGFLPFEKIIVEPFPDPEEKNTYFLVVEGNRRVAALKWIMEDYEAGVDIPDDVKAVLDAVPVSVVDPEQTDRSVILSLMGVRHVGGIRGWDGYQRAKLVAELRDEFELDTPEVAARLAMTPHEVNRRYRAYRALKQMEEDDEFGGFAQPRMYPLFHEAVAGRVVKDWLAWNEEQLYFTDEENLRTFYELITPHASEDDDSEEREPKIRTREEVRDLRDVIPVADARRAMLDPRKSFTEALALAKAEEFARSWLAEVDEAHAALRQVSAVDLGNLSAEELDSIRSLAEVARRLLELHETVAGRAEAT